MSLIIGTIYGVSVGMEYQPDVDDPEIQSAFTIDLFVLRLAFVKWRSA